MSIEVIPSIVLSSVIGWVIGQLLWVTVFWRFFPLRAKARVVSTRTTLRCCSCNAVVSWSAPGGGDPHIAEEWADSHECEAPPAAPDADS